MKNRSNNVIELMNRKNRGRTRVVKIFPNGISGLMLVCARLRRIESIGRVQKRYMSVFLLDNCELDNELIVDRRPTTKLDFNT